MAINTDYKRFTNQKQWKAYIQYLLMTNENALKRAIIIIYNNQTQEEKQRSESIQENNIGFGKIDADVMSKIAIKILKGKKLSEGELAKSRNKMRKYWKQLMIFSKKRLEDQRKAEEQYEEEMKRETIISEFDSKQFDKTQQIKLECYLSGKPCQYGICDECSFLI